MLTVEKSTNESNNISEDDQFIATEPTSYIAIIGGGPKGMFGLERLVSELQVQKTHHRIEIHIFNRTSFFGSGDVYRTDQPEFLKMNVQNKDIDIWGNESSLSVMGNTPSYTKWLTQQNIVDDNLKPTDYSSRTTVGQYLEDSFAYICNHLPDKVHIATFIGEALDLKKNNSDKYYIQFQGAENEQEEWLPYPYEQILLATGHPKKTLTPQENEWYIYNCKHTHMGFVPFVYPVESTLGSIMPKTTVGIKGMGLTFIDATLALTEGRGGKFQLLHNRLKYIPSGHEPSKIYPFSRSGLPMVARGEEQQLKDNELHFFTKAKLEALKDNKPLNFENDILPLLKQEMIYVYYKTLMHNVGYTHKQKNNSFDSFKEIVNDFLEKNKSIPPLDIDAYFNPLKDIQFNSSEELNEYIIHYIHQANNEAQLGAKKSPFAALSQVWRLATPIFGEVFKFGGLSPLSHKKFIKEYAGMLNRLTYGPPVENMQKILALAEAGIVDFKIGACKEIKLNKEKAQFLISSQYNDQPFNINYLIDARIPKVAIDDSNRGIYHNLLQRGEITMFTNACEELQEVYQPGCMNIDKYGYILDSDGQVNKAIAATGTPTEGITFDNDALSPHRNNFVTQWAKNIAKIYSEA